MKDLVIETTTSSKGQTVIPKYIRERLAVKHGTKLIWRINAGGEAVVKKAINSEPLDWSEWAKKARGLGKEIWIGVDPVKYVHDIWDDADSI